MENKTNPDLWELHFAILSVYKLTYRLILKD